MEARQVDRLPSEPGWQFEPKWDGFRCFLFRAAKGAGLQGKSGKSLARFFPEIVSLVERMSPLDFALDGELVVAAGGAPSFDALQMRLHPAESRIRRLSQETPATVILFDALAIAGRTLLGSPFFERREALEGFYKNAHEPLLRLYLSLAITLSPAIGFRRAVAHRRRGREAAGWFLRAGQALHDQGEAAAHGGLRRRRLPLSRTRAPCGFAASRLV